MKGAYTCPRCVNLIAFGIPHDCALPEREPRVEGRAEAQKVPSTSAHAVVSTAPATPLAFNALRSGSASMLGSDGGEPAMAPTGKALTNTGDGTPRPTRSRPSDPNNPGGAR